MTTRDSKTWRHEGSTNDKRIEKHLHAARGVVQLGLDVVAQARAPLDHVQGLELERKTPLLLPASNDGTVRPQPRALHHAVLEHKVHCAEALRGGEQLLRLLGHQGHARVARLPLEHVAHQRVNGVRVGHPAQQGEEQHVADQGPARLAARIQPARLRGEMVKRGVTDTHTREGGPACWRSASAGGGRDASGARSPLPG